MTQLGTREPVTGVITVADLLSRYSPATTAPEPDTAPVSVQSILRREGRASAPDAEFDGPEYDGPGRLTTGALVRRGAIAAGVVLAAGSVLGAAIVTSGPPAPAGSNAPLPEETPGRPWLDQQAPAAPSIPSIAPTTATGGLDAGEDVDRSWMNTAFPSALDEAPEPAAPASESAPPADDASSAPDTTETAAAPADSAGEQGQGNNGNGNGGNGDGGDQDGAADGEQGDGDQGGDEGGDDGPRRGPVGTLLGGLVDTVGSLLN